MNKQIPFYLSNTISLESNLTTNMLYRSNFVEHMTKSWIVIGDLAKTSNFMFGTRTCFDTFEDANEFVKTRTSSQASIDEKFDSCHDYQIHQIFIDVENTPVQWGLCMRSIAYVKLLLDDETLDCGEVSRKTFGTCPEGIYHELCINQIAKVDISERLQIQYRPHRGGLDESMKEMKTFRSIAEMKQFIIDTWKPLGVQYTMDDIVIDPEGIIDERTGWYTRYVCVTHMGNEHFNVPQCVGMCCLTFNFTSQVPDDLFQLILPLSEVTK